MTSSTLPSDVSVCDPRGALDEETELAAGAAGGPRLERGSSRHHQRDDGGGEELAERERPDDRDERDRVDADVAPQQRARRGEHEGHEHHRGAGRPGDVGPALLAREPEGASGDDRAERDGRQAPVAKLPHLLREEGGLVDRYQLLASVRSCGRATRMRASTTTARSGRPMHRVEVELRELGEVVGELREPVEDVGERGGVGRRRAAEARDELPALPEPTSSSASTSVRGVSRKCASPMQLGEDPAGAEGDERAEDRVLRHACEELDAALDHRLHDHRAADSLRSGPDGLRRRRDRGRRRRVSVLCAPAAAVLTTTG